MPGYGVFRITTQDAEEDLDNIGHTAEVSVDETTPGFDVADLGAGCPVLEHAVNCRRLKV